ncbi:MAG: hypothetical protein ACREXY_18275 [Gammaproteobacteria bacterium]
MPQPDFQSIVIVAAVDLPVATWALKEAAQVNFDQSDEVPQNDLLEAVLELVSLLRSIFTSAVARPTGEQPVSTFKSCC